MTPVELSKALSDAVAPLGPDYGRIGKAEMIEAIRARAKRAMAEAEQILAAADHEFQIETYVGQWVQRKRETIQKSTRIT